jgi:hypothetical protein
MPPHLRPLVVGSGVDAAHVEGAHGTVVGTFRHGCYVQVGGDVYAIAGPAVAPGPIHLIVAEPPARVTEGRTVWRDGARLHSSQWQVELGGAALFAPWRPGRAGLHHAAAALGSMLESLAVPADLQRRWHSVRSAVAAGDLVASRELLEGRGGGLTPTGDDVLAGLLLVHAWRGVDEDTLLRVARDTATTNLSRSFLAWAARGQSVAPVHDLVACAARHDRPAFDHAVGTVSAIGGSSGTALLWGIGLATAASVNRARPEGVPPARSSS